MASPTGIIKSVLTVRERKLMIMATAGEGKGMA